MSGREPWKRNHVFPLNLLKLQVLLTTTTIMGRQKVVMILEVSHVKGNEVCCIRGKKGLVVKSIVKLCLAIHTIDRDS